MKKVFIVFLALAGACLLFFFGQSYLLIKNKPSIGTITVYQKITKAKTDSLPYNKFFVQSGSTALDLLKKTVSVKTKGEGKNAFVIMIDKYEASSEKREYWAFFVNGQYAQIGAGSYILKNNDKLEWKIDNY